MNLVGFQTYRKTDITTADSKRLIIMCYEGVIQNLGIAKQNFLKGDYESKGRAVQKSLDIINALKEALNFEFGGEIAKNLDRIYNFAIKYIIRSDIKKNFNAFDELILIFNELKSAWEKALIGDQLNKGGSISQLPHVKDSLKRESLLINKELKIFLQK